MFGGGVAHIADQQEKKKTFCDMEHSRLAGNTTTFNLLQQLPPSQVYLCVEYGVD